MDNVPAVRRCRATVKSTGEQCKKLPISGAEVCRAHGGAAPQVRAKAAERVLKAKINGQLIKESISPVHDPVAYYSMLAGEIWAFKELAAAQVSDLDDWVSILEGPGGMAMGEQARAVIGVYQAAVAQCDRTLGNMVRLGLDAQALKLAAEKPDRDVANQVFEALGRALSTVGFSGEQQGALLTALEAELSS